MPEKLVVGCISISDHLRKPNANDSNINYGQTRMGDRFEISALQSYVF
jgi:hypothetical protein